MIPALTVRQPWASLLVDGVKPLDVRPWATRYRGPLLIHAGATPPPALIEVRRMVGAFTVPLGVLLGVVTLVDVQPLDAVWPELDDVGRATCGDRCAPDAFAWLTADSMRLSDPVPCRGAQGLWRVPWALWCRVAPQLSVHPRTQSGTS